MLELTILNPTSRGLIKICTERLSLRRRFDWRWLQGEHKARGQAEGAVKGEQEEHPLRRRAIPRLQRMPEGTAAAHALAQAEAEKHIQRCIKLGISRKAISRMPPRPSLILCPLIAISPPPRCAVICRLMEWMSSIAAKSRCLRQM